MSATPLGTLLDLAAAHASGELVCVHDTCELHVFLQSGNVAWATDSSAPFAFGRYLLEHTTLTRETFHEVLESCRRDRLPLGETLIAWQLVTLEQIREALAHQIRGALGTLASCRDGRTVFLERRRQFASYDVTLTFPIETFLGQALDPAPGSERSLLREALLAAVPDATWLDVLDAEWSTRGRVPAGLARASLLDGADRVILRTGHATYLGATVSERQFVWCELEPEAAFGIALTSISTEIAQHRSSPPSAETRSELPLVPRQIIGGGTSIDGIRELVGRAFDMAGALVVDRTGLAGVLPESWDADAVVKLVERRAPLLSVPVPQGPEGNLESLGYRLRSVATCEPRMWCFGAQVGSERDRTIWLFLERRCAQALGWAYLASLSRQVEGMSTGQWEAGWHKVG